MHRFRRVHVQQPDPLLPPRPRNRTVIVSPSATRTTRPHMAPSGTPGKTVTSAGLETVGGGCVGVCVGVGVIVGVGAGVHVGAGGHAGVGVRVAAALSTVPRPAAGVDRNGDNRTLPSPSPCPPSARPIRTPIRTKAAMAMTFRTVFNSTSSDSVTRHCSLCLRRGDCPRAGGVQRVDVPICDKVDDPLVHAHHSRG